MAVQLDENGNPILQKRRILGVDPAASTIPQQQTQAQGQAGVNNVDVQFVNALKNGDPNAIKGLLNGNNPITRIDSVTAPATPGTVQQTPGYNAASNNAVVAAPRTAAQGTAPRTLGATGYQLAQAPTTSYQGSFVAPRTIAEDQKNTNSLLTSLQTGAGVVDANGNVYSPADVFKNLAAQGNPLGTAWLNANTANRENQIGAAGADAARAYDQAAQRFGSGQVFNQAFAPAQAAAAGLATAGNPNFQFGQTAGVAAQGVARGMGADISQLRQAAAGTVPSAAAVQQQQGLADAIRLQQAQASSARGGNAAAAARTAAAAGGALQSRSLADAAALRANEMATARGQLTAATQAQGGLYNQAGALQGQLGQALVGRAGAASAAQQALGTQNLNAQLTGANMANTGYERDQARVLNQVATDQDEQRQLQNYLLQLFNTTNGNAAQIDNSQRAAAVQTRGQNLQLLGAGVSAGANVLGNLIPG